MQEEPGGELPAHQLPFQLCQPLLFGMRAGVPLQDPEDRLQVAFPAKGPEAHHQPSA